MQPWFLIDPALVVLIEALLAFIFVISLGLFRFATGVRYKSWSIGWTLFTTTILSSALTTGSGLVLSDIVATAGMMVGTMFLIDGSNEKVRRNREYLIYPILALVGIVLVLIGLFFGLSYGIVFTPVGFFTTYACWLTVTKLRAITSKKNFDYYLLIIGFSVWGFSTLLFPISIWVYFLDVQTILLASGIVLAGSSLLMVLIGSTTENLQTQYSISQLMSGILNHDIRNYVGSLSESVEQFLLPGSDREFWMELVKEITTGMAEFVEDMRKVNASLSRFELVSEPIQLRPVIEEIKTRVEREYSLKPDQIRIDVSHDGLVMTSGIVREMFWNIADNAFKHGSPTLEIAEVSQNKNLFFLEIRDEAGGMTEGMHNFLNDPNALTSLTAPGMGLGLILIRGLSLLCKVQLHVHNRVIDSKIVGTVFTFEFERYMDVGHSVSMKQVTNPSIGE